MGLEFFGCDVVRTVSGFAKKGEINRLTAQISNL